MAKMNRFQFNEIKQELSYQINRIERELQLTRKLPPGMLKSRKRLKFLLDLFKQLEKDGWIELVSDSEMPNETEELEVS